MSEREKFDKWDLEQCQHNATQTERLWNAWNAALSTRKPCGYGIVDTYGAPIPFRASLWVNAQDKAEILNRQSDAGCPFRVVELFYEDSES